jgi:GMP synthase-like glutamine amidotransferase
MIPPAAKHIVSDHPEKIRMLVLETDETHPDTQKEHGGFGEVLGTLFKRAGDNHDPTLGIETVMQYIVEDDGGEIPRFEEIGDDIHAILITGSVYDAHGNDEWIIKLMKLIERTYDSRMLSIEHGLMEGRYMG